MMKRFLSVCVMGLTVAALVAGCSNKNASTQTDAASATKAVSNETAAEETAAEETAAPETMATVDLSSIDFGTVTLGEYKGIEAVKKVETVNDAELEDQTVMSLSSYAEYKDVDRPVRISDKVNIDYVGTKDGVAFDGGTAQGYDLTIGSGSFIPGFEDGLVGAKKGDEVTLPLTFPERYQNADLAGQAVEFKVKINNIQGFEADDALVAANTDYKTFDEYKESLREDLLSEAEAQAMDQVQRDILTAVVENATVEKNQEAVDASYENYVAQYTNQAAAYGVDLATFAGAFMGMDEASLKEQLRLMADASVEQRLIFQAIASQENISIGDAERESLAADMGYESKEAMIDQAGAYTVDDYILSTKVMDFLVENAVIK